MPVAESRSPVSARKPAFGKKRFWLPAAHGSWTWWIGPLLIGLAAGGHPRWNFVSLVIAALAGFLLLQPATIAAKVLSGRRPRTDLKPALGWCAIYAVVCLSGIACIVQAGDVHVLGLAAPGLLVFGIYLWLVFRHAERRQMAMEMLASGVMALAAPAAYWAAGGTDYPLPWVLWALTWLQSAAAIANVYLRLDQRRWPDARTWPERLQAGHRTLVHHVAGFAAALLFFAVGQAPLLTIAAFAIPLVDAVDTVRRPLPGARPAVIGMRQLAVTTAFAAVMVFAFLGDVG